MDNLPDGVAKLTGSLPGPALAIFAGVHGDERAGILAINEMLPKLKITRGTLYVILANQLAVQQNVRQVNKNLNRLFSKNVKGNTYEDKRAHELIDVLDECDILLDLHQFKYITGGPFAICENNALDIAKIFDIEIISTNWTLIEPGATDGYMYETGKLGICLECGSIKEAKKYKEFAIRSVKQFLTYFDMTEEKLPPSTIKKRIIEAKKSVVRTEEDFEINPSLYNFQKLLPSQILGRQADTIYKAKAGEYLIFPDPNVAMGGEAWIIGEGRTLLL